MIFFHFALANRYKCIYCLCMAKDNITQKTDSYGRIIFENTVTKNAAIFTPWDKDVSFGFLSGGSWQSAHSKPSKSYKTEKTAFKAARAWCAAC